MYGKLLCKVPTQLASPGLGAVVYVPLVDSKTAQVVNCLNRVIDIRNLLFVTVLSGLNP